MNRIKCGVCDGSGKSPRFPTYSCDHCGGDGVLELDPAFTEVCKLCDGSGKDRVHQTYACSRCGGRRYVPPPGYKAPPKTLPPEDLPVVCYVQAGKPWTAQLQLEKIFENVSGGLRICDPFYGRRSLLSLDLLNHCKPIKFLTSRADSGETQTIESALLAWKKEHGDVDFRRSAGRDSHDRFVLSEHELILLGHGLKDVGSKDSFIIRISRDIAGDMIDTVREAFDKRWQEAKSIV
jgi:hypothetical protein